MSVLTQAIAAGVLAGFVSMGIAFFVTTRLNRAWLTRMVSFAAGLMLTIALLDLLPEALGIISFTPYQNLGGIEQNHLYAFSFIASFPFAARAPPYSA